MLLRVERPDQTTLGIWAGIRIVFILPLQRAQVKDGQSLGILVLVIEGRLVDSATVVFGGGVNTPDGKYLASTYRVAGQSVSGVSWCVVDFDPVEGRQRQDVDLIIRNAGCAQVSAPTRIDKSGQYWLAFL